MSLTETFAIVVAAGKGLRMGSTTKKQYLRLNGIPVLARTLMALDTCAHLCGMILVVPKEDRAYCQKNILDPFGFKHPIQLAAGGRERQDSVFCGLKKVLDTRTPEKETLVMIHDGVRPFVSQSLIENCRVQAIEHGACIPVMTITDTVKVLAPDSTIQKTLDRSSLFGAQTPQVFKLGLLLRAFDHAGKTSFSATDEASLVEHLGQKVMTVRGEKQNIKLTTQEDLILGKFLLNQPIA